MITHNYEMEKIKKVYVDSLFKTTDSNSDTGFKYEIKETSYLTDNIICYVDGISIPHIGEQLNRITKFYNVQNGVSCR